MHYDVVYDITRELPPMELVAVGSLFATIGALLFRFERETAVFWRLETTPADLVRRHRDPAARSCECSVKHQ